MKKKMKCRIDKKKLVTVSYGGGETCSSLRKYKQR